MPTSNQIANTERYQLIPRTLIFLTCSDQVLLIRGSPDKPLWANLYNGLGGHVERGEDVLGAARRELLEESGLDVESLWLSGIVTVDTGKNPGICIFILRGEIPCQDGFRSVQTKNSKEGALEWIPVERLQDYPLVDDLYILLPEILAKKAGDNPIYARNSYDDLGSTQIIINSSK